MFISILLECFFLAILLPCHALANPATPFARKGFSSSPALPEPYDGPSPNITNLTAQFFHRYKSQRVVIRYGPFTTLPSTTNNGMDTYEVINAPTPCTDCLVTYIAADLEYPDGTQANTDTGMWLHHALLYSTKEDDAVCPLYYPRRIFATGNERTPADISVNGTKHSGIYLPANVTFLLQPELMNELPTPRDVYLAITYEFIPTKPSRFKTVTPVWLDITGVCGNSDFPVPAESAFSITSSDWTANVTGEVVFTAGHLHDGGTVLHILKRNDSKCDSNATYAATPGYVTNVTYENPDVMPGDTSQDLLHISNMSSCADIGHMRDGQAWSVRAEYDFTKHAGMLQMAADGSGQQTKAPIMGIALLYVSQKNDDDDDDKKVVS